MEHSFLDKYNHLNSFVHRLNPQIKLITFFSYMLFVVFTLPTDWVRLGAYFIMLVVMVLLSKVPPIYILKKSLLIIPFVLIAGFIPFYKEGEIAAGFKWGWLDLKISYPGLLIFWNVLVKSWLVTVCLILLASTTKFSEMLKVLEKMKFPKILIIILAFIYRYIFVLVDDLQQARRDWEPRYFGGRYWFQWKIFSNIIGLLFIRAYERGERVYQSMLARGFKGEILMLNNSQIRKIDVIFLIGFLGKLVMIRIVGGWF